MSTKYCQLQNVTMSQLQQSTVVMVEVFSRAAD